MPELDHFTGFSNARIIIKKFLVTEQVEADGGVLRRAIGSELGNLDPFVFVFLFSATPPGGFRDHPHRGFQAVTLMLEGAFTNQDNSGHKGILHAGDVQWMTAGRGIIHSEMPSGPRTNAGFQVWVNLPSSYKMIAPNYLELPSGEIAKAERDGVKVRVIAGESMGARSPFYTKTPITFLDFTLQPGAQVHQTITDSWNAFVYVLEGGGVFGRSNDSPYSAHHILVLGRGEGLSAWNRSSGPLRFILAAGQPLNEPVVQYGPFVMNTQAQIDQTIEDYRSGRNGFEKDSH